MFSFSFSHVMCSPSSNHLRFSFSGSARTLGVPPKEMFVHLRDKSWPRRSCLVLVPPGGRCPSPRSWWVVSASLPHRTPWLISSFAAIRYALPERLRTAVQRFISCGISTSMSIPSKPTHPYPYPSPYPLIKSFLP